MNTPICDFVRSYVRQKALRLHMPGHKGAFAGFAPFSSLFPYDITEIPGADSLYEAAGIIRESEENAGKLFGAPTFYSTEGSSLAVRAMLYLLCLYARQLHPDRKPRIAAARNVHKSFISAAALLDFDIQWLYPPENASYLSCLLNTEELARIISETDEKPDALYITSPDYLGNRQDIAALSDLCHQQSILLLVDNAHGAYLKFLPVSEHPIDVGADLCCDSAHKTLPVLTGGAYLHISRNAPDFLAEQAKAALALFGSTSPSYLILQSLDAVNPYLAAEYPKKLAAFLVQVQELKKQLTAHGFSLVGNEPLKLTLSARPYGYTGTGLASLLAEKNIICEFADADFLVLMLTPETGENGLDALEKALCAIPPQKPLLSEPPLFHPPKSRLSVREALFSRHEICPLSLCAGKILAAANVSCPPAVPIVVSGEQIDETLLPILAYYGTEACEIVAETNE